MQAKIQPSFSAPDVLLEKAMFNTGNNHIKTIIPIIINENSNILSTIIKRV